MLLYYLTQSCHITYGLEVWGAACKTFINPILILQKRMARVITFKDRKHHSNPVLLELNLLDVFKEYRYLTGIFMYDLLNNNLPHRITDYFSCIDHMYKTRNKEKCNLKIEAIRTNVGKQSISYSGAVIWNSIPTMLRNITSRKQLSRDLKKNLLEEYKA